MTDKCDTFVARWDHAMCSRCGEEHDRPAPTPTTPGLDGFMADRGHPYMTPSEVATAEAEYHAPAPGLDLEEIERAERAMTPGLDLDTAEKRAAGFRGTFRVMSYDSGDELLEYLPAGGDDDEPDEIAQFACDDEVQRAIVDTLNAAPALIAEVRALRSEVAWLRVADRSGPITRRDHTIADRDAEIARLTAELAAARAVPADVEAAIDAFEVAVMRDAGATTATCGDLRLAHDHLRAAIARAIAEARQPATTVGTVGGLLAAAPVGAIVEWRSSTGRGWWQLRVRVDGNGVECRTCADGWPWGGWRTGQLLAGDMPRPARLVPDAEADAEADHDPSTRGPLPKGG